MAIEIDTTRLLCTLAELEPTGCREFRLGGGEWPVKGFVVRVGEGARAYVNRCAHVAYPLNHLPDVFLGLDGAAIQCRMHGALFEKETGHCIAGPCAGQSLIPLPVAIVGDYVLLGGEDDPAELAARYA
ncbi:MAG: Rieske 2Fe-2S domain-containing protein [Steroidobacteraceae bacterium]